MNIKQVVVTGDAIFLERYQHLFTAISSHCEHLEYLTYGTLNETRKLQKIKNILPNNFLKPLEKLFRKNQRTFIQKSQETESKIRQLGYRPDLVFHLFSLYSPFWNHFDIPYVMYLDYTMALAERNWSPWAPFSNTQELDFWLDCERRAYTQSHHLFSMSSVVKDSLINNYGISPQKITVVGASGNFKEPYGGEKIFGSQQILFNGSDWERKGGNLIVAAFQKVKHVLPNAKLMIIGKKLALREDGIENPGHISDPSAIRDLFLNTDLVVAPAYCDPFPVFLMEAMNYGIPCIISARDGMPEIVDHEDNGLVIAQPSPENLADEIINLLSKPSRLELMSQRARYKIKTELNWNHIAAKILQVLST